MFWQPGYRTSITLTRGGGGGGGANTYSYISHLRNTSRMRSVVFCRLLTMLSALLNVPQIGLFTMSEGRLTVLLSSNKSQQTQLSNINSQVTDIRLYCFSFLDLAERGTISISDSNFGIPCLYFGSGRHIVADWEGKARMLSTIPSYQCLFLKRISKQQQTQNH